MGTNFYLHRDVCPHCGSKLERLHIGKSSWRPGGVIAVSPCPTCTYGCTCEGCVLGRLDPTYEPPRGVFRIERPR